MMDDYIEAETRRLGPLYCSIAQGEYTIQIVYMGTDLQLAIKALKEVKNSDYLKRLFIGKWANNRYEALDEFGIEEKI